MFDGVVYARAEGGSVVLRNVLGQSKVVSGCAIAEVNVAEAKLVLSRA